VLDKTPADLHDQMKDPLDRTLQVSSQEEPVDRFEEAPDELRAEASEAIQVLEEGLLNAIAAEALPEKHRKRLRTTNMVERLIQEVRRREKVIRIFPNKASAWRLIGALSAEKHEEWSTGRRYWTMDEVLPAAREAGQRESRRAPDSIIQSHSSTSLTGEARYTRNLT